MRSTYETRIGHVQLRVRDLQTAVDFYVRYFNLCVVERIDNAYARLVTGDPAYAGAQQIALEAVGGDAPAASEFAPGLVHIAFTVPDRRSLAAALRRLQMDEVAVQAVDHGGSLALYFHDPDGNGLSLYWQTGAKAQQHAPHNHAPRLLDLAVILGE